MIRWIQRAFNASTPVTRSTLAKGLGALTVALGAVLFSPTASAAPVVPCSTGIGSLFPDNGTWLSISSARVTARGHIGFTAFSMADGYQIETTPLNTPAAAQAHHFFAYRSDTNVYSGYFHLVFTDRSNPHEDRWQIWINRAGNIWVRPAAGTWTLLPNPVCYRGPENQIVVTANVDNPGFGTDFWTFVMHYGILI